ncbi:mevalonate kinase [Anoplophora glabripennis]|uniref:mevalonate kinase n=1 Tax=Anoplophora glabripennis TaxID=217634 RepID=UPI000874DA07|nr:mevalonate kinase [Anoplophora glabripennis]
MLCNGSVLPPNIHPTGLTVSVSAPGKVILHGDHSVVYGKLALTASLGLRSRMRLIEISAPNLVIFQLPILDFTLTYDLEKLREYLLIPMLPLTHNANEFNWEYPEMIHHDAILDIVDSFISYTSGTAPLNVHQKMALSSVFFLIAGILGSVNIELNSFLMTCETDLFIGAGTGSSASFVVSLAAALLQFVKMKTGGQGNISKEEYKACFLDAGSDKNFSKRELDMICKWAFCAEKIVHGTPSGVDNTTCTYGGIVEFRKGLAPKLLEMLRPLKILLINTKVSRETRKLVSKVAALHHQYPDLTNNILNAMEDVAFIALQHITSLCTWTGTTEGLVNDQIRNSYEELGRLASINHSLLSALGVSHLRLDEVIHILAENGLQGKLTGAGGGGYATCLVSPYVNPSVLEKAMLDLDARGFQAVLTEVGGNGVMIE